MSKTLPNLYYPQDITWSQLIFVIVPASILSVILFVITILIMATIQFSFWLFHNTPEISIYSHRGADNNDPRKRQHP